MSSVSSRGSFAASRLPDNIFDLENDQFYEFLQSKYGNDLAQLISFQSIRNGEHLLEATIDEILLVLNEDSKEIDELRKICCFQVTANEFKVKLGVKLAINSLIQSLKTKQLEKAKKKRRSIDQSPSLSSRLNAETLNQTQIIDEISSPTSLFNPPLPDNLNSTESQILRLQKKSTEIAHKMDIERRMNRWWSLSQGIDNLSVNEGIDYLLHINKSINNTYTSVLSCSCGVRFKLPFAQPGFFKLSSFYRHVKEKQCFQMTGQKLTQENDVTDNENIQLTHTTILNVSSNEQSQIIQTSQNATAKRFQTPSIKKARLSKQISGKKNRPSSLNSIVITQ